MDVAPNDSPVARRDASTLVRACRRGMSTLRAKLRVLSAVGRSRRQFRSVDLVGRWSRVTGGHAVILNAGTVELGERVRLMCEYGTTEVRVGPQAVLRIGDRTAINYGTDIQVGSSVQIGSRVSIGPRCIIADTPFQVPDDPRSRDGSAIVIGDDVWLASRVTVLPGARIGAGSVITAGSVVSGTIPAGVLAGGAPIRVLRQLDGGSAGPVLVDGFPSEESADPSLPAQAPTNAFEAPAPHLTEPLALGGLLISDFTIDPLARALESAHPWAALTTEVAPFGAVVPTLLNPPTEHADFAAVWTRPQAVLPCFVDIIDGDRTVSSSMICDEVDRFAELVGKGLGDFRSVFVINWTLPPWNRGHGLSDLRPGGLRWALSIANTRLIEAFAPFGNVFLLDAQRWVGSIGESSFSQRLWFLGKIPFNDSVFEHAATEIVDGLGAVRSGPRKLLVLDLDNTLWGGVVGDDGWSALRLGGHDGVGEAFVEFQKSVRRLRQRGIALAIVSKNEENVALEAIDQHPEMILRRDDFVGWRINWSDKAANILDLTQALNLGLQSVVFIDDNPHERNRVREALPEVFVPVWPDDPTDYVRAIETLSCFDTVATTEEDRQRTEMYLRENQRQQLRASVVDLDQWIRELGVVVRAERLDEANLTRATQLLNKTNQMNLRTRRLSEGELLDWASGEDRETYCVTVSDRLGDAGLTGILSLNFEGETAHIVDFVLSCRVMGRRVEESLTHIAASISRAHGARRLIAELLPTEKNLPCRRYLDRSVFIHTSDERFELPLDVADPAPADVRILIDGLEASKV